MKKLLLVIGIAFISISANATIHVVQVWNGYYQFLPNSLTMNLGDTIEWRKLDDPTMYHTITSTSIPAGAVAFDVDWQMPADTFFQYVPAYAGTYYYECTPHVTSFNMVGSFTVNPVAGIQSMGENSFDVYPNPAIESLNIQGGTCSEFKIMSLAGKLMMQGKLEGEINIRSIPPGGYILVLGDKSPIRFNKISR